MAFWDFLKEFNLDSFKGKDAGSDALGWITGKFSSSPVMRIGTLIGELFAKLFGAIAGNDGHKEFIESGEQILKADAIKTIGAEIQNQLGDYKTLYKYKNEASEKIVQDMLAKATEFAKNNSATYLSDGILTGKEREELISNVRKELKLDKFNLKNLITKVGTTDEYSGVLVFNEITRSLLRTNDNGDALMTQVLPYNTELTKNSALKK